MMEIKKVLATSVKKGSTLVIDGAACTVTNVQTSKPGKHGHAKCRIEAIGMIDNKKRIIVVPGHDKLDSPLIEKKNAQILSIHERVATVMDMDGYETFDLQIPEELKDKAMEGKQILYWIILDEKVMKEIKD